MAIRMCWEPALLDRCAPSSVSLHAELLDILKLWCLAMCAWRGVVLMFDRGHEQAGLASTVLTGVKHVGSSRTKSDNAMHIVRETMVISLSSHEALCTSACGGRTLQS